MLQNNNMKILAILVLAIALTSCTNSDIEDLPRQQPDTSSSSAGNSSSIVGISSSSSNVVLLSNSSSSLKADNVICLVGVNCAETTQITCDALGGIPVSSCPASSDSASSSSNGNVQLSSSSIASSSSITPSSSSIAARNCQITKNGSTHCYEMSENDCFKYNGTLSSCTKTTLSCGDYCLWDVGCYEITTDPGGVYNTAYSSCDAAIYTCDAYGDRFSNSSCSGVPIGKYCYSDVSGSCKPIRNLSSCTVVSVCPSCTIQSEAACLNQGGSVRTRTWCINNALNGLYESNCGL